MSHLHSLAQSMYIATFLPEHVLTTCFADYVTSTSGAIRLAFDLLPLASSFGSLPFFFGYLPTSVSIVIPPLLSLDIHLQCLQQYLGV